MKKYIDNDINDEIILGIVNKINNSQLSIKNFLKSINKDFDKLITHKCLNYLLLLEKLFISNKLKNEVMQYEIIIDKIIPNRLIINNGSNGLVKYQESVKESILYHMEDFIDNILDRLKYNNDFYYEIFSNLEYKQTRKYIFTCLISTMNEPEFYTESKEYKYEVPMLYWDCFKFIFSYLTESEEFLKIFLKSMYEIEDKKQHMDLLNELLKNFEPLDDSFFEPIINGPSIKYKLISIIQTEIKNYKTIIDNSI